VDLKPFEQTPIRGGFAFAKYDRDDATRAISKSENPTAQGNGTLVAFEKL
jgi:hypothetical protein